MIVRFFSLMIVIWALGFAAFVLMLPEPADDRRTDAIVVLTGGAGRIQRGAALLQAGKAQRMLVAGVDRRVLPHELAAEHDVPESLFARRITLGHESVDTRTNAVEAGDWIDAHRFRSVRLVTTDWHMPRARFELSQVLEPDIVLVADAVPSEPGLMLLLTEYNKYLLRRAAALFGI